MKFQEAPLNTMSFMEVLNHKKAYKACSEHIIALKCTYYWTYQRSFDNYDKEILIMVLDFAKGGTLSKLFEGENYPEANNMTYLK